MGLRFRKSIRTGKYFRINVSKSGVGYSFGVPGARITHSANGRVSSTVGIPGTGISYTQSFGTSSSRKPRRNPGTSSVSVPADSGIGVAQSTELADIDRLQPAELTDMLKCLKKACSVNSFGTVLTVIGIIIALLFTVKMPKTFPGLVIGVLILIGGITAKVIAHTKLPVSLDYDLDEEITRQHNARIAAWQGFFSSASKWQIITSAEVKNRKVNAGAAAIVSRVGVSMSTKAPFYIKTGTPTAILNLESEKLLILPDKMIVIKGKKFGAVDYKDLTLSTRKGQFIERGTVPRDAEIVGYTWQYVNKNGSPDKRYSNNRRIPLCLYGYVTLKSGTGFEIQLSCSDNSKIEGMK